MNQGSRILKELLILENAYQSLAQDHRDLLRQIFSGDMDIQSQCTRSFRLRGEPHGTAYPITTYQKMSFFTKLTGLRMKLSRSKLVSKLEETSHSQIYCRKPTRY